MNKSDSIAINLVVSPILIQPIAILDFEPAVIGTPIMREGFMTETGFFPQVSAQ